MPYNKLLTNLASSSRTGEYWPSVVLYGPRCARSVLPRPRANIPRYGPRARLVRGYYLLRTEITKSHLNDHICQYRGMKTSTVTPPPPSFYYVFNISWYCNDTIPSFIGYLWRVLLLGWNHLNCSINENNFKN